MFKYCANIIYIILVLFSFKSFAYEAKIQHLEQLDFSIKIGSIQNNQVHGYFLFSLQKGWKTYWRSVGDGGFSLEVKLTGDNVSDLKLLWQAPYSFVDENDMRIYGYKGDVRIPFSFEIHVLDEKKINFNLEGEYAVCDILCVSHSFAEEIILDTNYLNEEIDENISEILEKVPSLVNGDDFEIIVKKDKILLKNIDSSYVFNEVFVEAGEDFRFLQPVLTNNEAVIYFEELLENKKLDNIAVTFTVLSDEANVEFVKDIKQSSLKTLLLMLLLAFLGGAILNIMPCVLPVVSLKLAHLSQAKCKLSPKAQLIYTILGILLSFIVLASLVITLRFIGISVGWGFHFQQPVFILIMITILISFSFSQLGFFNISTKGADNINSIFKRLSKDKAIYHIFYGTVITLLATPCTAPMLGSAMGFALTQPAIITLLLFLSVALGLALPYILLVILPFSPKNILPKPGNWLNYMKYITIFLLYSSALWLLFVLFFQIGALSSIFLFLSINFLILFFVKAKFKTISILLLILVIFAPLLIPNYQRSAQNSKIWHKFDEAKITEISKEKIIFIDIGAKWCLTCKFNKFRVLSSKNVIKALSQEHVYAMRGDMTKRNIVLDRFIKKHNRAGIPFNAVIKNGEFIVLSEILNKKKLINYLEK